MSDFLKVDGADINLKTALQWAGVLGDDEFIQRTAQNAVLIQYPLQIDGAQCIIDVLKMKCYKFGPEGGKPEKVLYCISSEKTFYYVSLTT